MKTTLLLITLLLATTAHAQVFRCPTPEGGVMYQQRLCLDGEEMAIQSAPSNVVPRGTIRIGMTRDQARQSLGNPERINRSSSGSGVREQWVYKRAGGSQSYLHFERGILKGWLEH